MKQGQVFPRRFLKLLHKVPADHDAYLPQGAKQVWYAEWQADVPLFFPFGDEPFVCILWNNRPGYISEFLIEQLLQAKCTYFIFGGEDCERWHDTTDILHLDHYLPDFNVPDDELVMSTWHVGEPLPEVLEFGLFVSGYQGREYEHYLIVQIDPELSPAQLAQIVEAIL